MLKTQPTNKEYKVEHLFSFVVELVSKLKIAYLNIIFEHKVYF